MLPCVTAPHRWRCGAVRFCYDALPPRIAGALARCHVCYSLRRRLWLALWRGASLLPCVTAPHRWRCGAVRFCYHVLPPLIVGVVARCDFVTMCYRPASPALRRSASFLPCVTAPHRWRCGALRVCYHLLPSRIAGVVAWCDFLTMCCRPASLALRRSASFLPCVTAPHRWRCGAVRLCYHALPPRIAGAVARWDFVTICYRSASLALWRGATLLPLCYRPASLGLWRSATFVTLCDNVYGCRCGAVRVCYRLLPVETGLAILEIATLSCGCACFVTARQLYLYNTN